MKATLAFLVTGILLGAGVANTATAATALPSKVGDCVLTKISWVGTRLTDANDKLIPDSGSAVNFANSLGQVSYDQVPAVDKSRVGDKVVVCLVELPKDCPPGDDRGKTYKTFNLETEESWILPDSAHGCGGA